MPVAERLETRRSPPGFQSVMENAIMHTASSEKESVEIDDILASIFEEKESFAAHFLARQGIDRLALLSFISHGVTVYPEPRSTESEDRAEEEADARPRRSRGARGKPRARPLQAYAVDLTEKARAGRIDPLIGREEILQRTIQVLCRQAEEQPPPRRGARGGKDGDHRGSCPDDRGGQGAQGAARLPYLCAGHGRPPRRARSSAATSRSG